MSTTMKLSKNGCHTSFAAVRRTGAALLGPGRAIELVNDIRLGGSTNMVAGVERGFDTFDTLPVRAAELPCLKLLDR